MSKIIKKIFRKESIVIASALLLVSLLWLPNKNMKKTVDDSKIQYTAFLEKADKGEVDSISIKGNKLIIKDSDGKVQYTTNPNTPTFKEEMLKKNISVEEYEPSPYMDNIINCIMWIIILFVGYALLKNLIKAFPVPNKKMSLNVKPIDNVGKKMMFDDVAGIEGAKGELEQVVDYLKEPAKYVEMGVKPRRGILLSGEPGTGKTLLAQALANEANVPFFSQNGSDFVEMYVGVGANRIRELFEVAKKNAPCVVFIDEIDALGKKRGNSNSGGSDERDQTLIALLTELNGFTASDGIVVIGATNRPEILDSALTRPGRFDKHIVVDTPDVKGREDILRIHSKNKNLDETVDLKKIARRTAGFSGADLANLLNESGIEAIRNKQSFISWKNVDSAYNSIVVGNKKERNMMTDKEKKIVAYHESGHALLTRLYAKLPIEKITILPTSKALGYVMRENKDICLKTKNEFMNDICISLGGRIAEEIIFGEDNITNGASADFENATKIAYNMVFKYGMSKIGNISLDYEIQNMWSDEIKNEAYKQVQDILKTAEELTRDYLNKNKDVLDKLANHMLDVETLEGEEFDEYLKSLNLQLDN